MRFTIPGAVCLISLAAPALAQSPYVAVGVGADVLRTRHVEASGFESPVPDGEAVSVSARGGTAITDRWGVELEFTHAAKIEREVRRGFPQPLLTFVAGPVSTISDIALPFFDATTRVSRRNDTLDAVAWVVQPIGGRVDLVYLGGVAFTRAVETVAFEFARRPGIAPIVMPNSTRTTTYGAGPVAGVEARVRLTTHVVLIPGVRLHGVAGAANAGGGWLIRPAVAAGWRF